ncbi:MAG: HEPN domain-containing protein [Oscillospiraceae bacterium]|jgi:HEPN domain-containing protein|nr:HEPN domain-containing protein [Oscillospiraceae bacterium]
MNEQTEYWFTIADYDIETARVMLLGGRYLYVGFMCHQVIEKALKGIIARDLIEGVMPPKIHHLLKLAELAGLYNVMSSEQQAFIKKLNPLNVTARYPQYKEAIASGLNAKVCGEFLTGTEELLCWIKQQL